MKWMEIKVVFEHPNRDAAMDLISDIFYEFRVQGVAIETPDHDPETDWADDIPKLPEKPAVIGYFADNEYLVSKLNRLEKKLGKLSADINLKTEIQYRYIDEKDWANSWKDFFYPIKITENIVIKPTWRKYPSKKDDIIIEIDPGMAFGTGSHPTTALCVTLLQKFSRFHENFRFLDIGVGSGILMIVAAKLGARHLAGTDTDETAVEIAQNNLIGNGIDKNSFHIHHSSLNEGIQGQFDIITANILTKTILELLDTVQLPLTENGIFICSGIIRENSEQISKAMKENNFHVLDFLVKDNWVAYACRKNHPVSPEGQPRYIKE